MNTFRIILYLLGILAFLFLVFLVYFTFSDYQPDKIKTLAKNKNSRPLNKDTVDLLIWNIGYCGLSEDMSFFYDGGEEVRTSEEKTRENLGSAKNYLKNKQTVDFFLLQEVDKRSKRSYYINEFDSISKALPNYKAFFALNYKVPFVPLPPHKPMGIVKSGLATFSLHTPFKVERHPFPGNYAWPKKLFMLDRCFMVAKYSLPGEHELLIINTHNSAYDDGGLKAIQMEHLKKYISKEYEKGNYIIAGGDWNQYPPDISDHKDSSVKYSLNKTTTISEDYMPEGWKWAYDPQTPTNRSLEKPLNENTDKTVIDFYLLSPNIEPIQIKTDDLKFKNSDHQPVYLKARLIDNK